MKHYLRLLLECLLDENDIDVNKTNFLQNFRFELLEGMCYTNIHGLCFIKSFFCQYWNRIWIISILTSWKGLVILISEWFVLIIQICANYFKRLKTSQYLMYWKHWPFNILFILCLIFYYYFCSESSFIFDK